MRPFQVCSSSHTQSTTHPVRMHSSWMHSLSRYPTDHPPSQDVFLAECTRCPAIQPTAHPVRMHSVWVHSLSRDPTSHSPSQNVFFSGTLFALRSNDSPTQSGCIPFRCTPSRDPAIHPPSRDVFLTTALSVILRSTQLSALSQSITRRHPRCHVPRSATYTTAIHPSQPRQTPDAPPSIRSRSNRLFAGHVADALAHYLKNQPTVHRRISRLYSCNPASHVA